MFSTKFTKIKQIMHEEVKKLIDHSFEYAQELLEDVGEFYPFGAYIDTAGNVHPLEYDPDAKIQPTVGKVLESLTKYCQTEIQENRMKGYALTYESEVQLQADEKPMNCISVESFHTEEENIPNFYMPFSLEDKNPNYLDVFGVKK